MKSLPSQVDVISKMLELSSLEPSAMSRKCIAALSTLYVKNLASIPIINNCFEKPKKTTISLNQNCQKNWLHYLLSICLGSHNRSLNVWFQCWRLARSSLLIFPCICTVWNSHGHYGDVPRQAPNPRAGLHVAKVEGTLSQPFQIQCGWARVCFFEQIFLFVKESHFLLFSEFISFLIWLWSSTSENSMLRSC